MKKIAITSGEPAGIGPDLIAQLLAEKHDFAAELIIIGNRDLLKERAKLLNLPWNLKDTQIIDVPLPQPCIPGQLNPANAAYVLETLKIAARGCLEGKFHAMVTPPVHKGIINQAGFTFSGHTEFLAEIAHVPQVVMMLLADELRVALATTHLPLAKVPSAITAESLEKTLRILHQDLKKRFGISNPKILVAGLNPHAGEGGYLGREEIDIINPVLEKLRKENFQLLGPLPADTLFILKNLAGADAVLAMYHDQGLPVLKYAGFGHAVNVTLGLPFIRTSVDHGTALDLAGKGSADPSSLKAAIDLAIKLL